MAYIKRGEAKTVPVRVKFNDMDVFPLGNAGNILKPKKNPKIKVLECTDEELME